MPRHWYMTYQYDCQEIYPRRSARQAGERRIEGRLERRYPVLAYAPSVDQREPLTKREDLLVFGVIALPIFAVTILIITLVVVLGTR